MMTCELCNTNEMFKLPYEKRLHLAENHFQNDLKSQFQENSKGEYKCPNLGCEFVGKYEGQCVPHAARVHKAVDNLLVDTLARQQSRGSRESGFMCPLCSSVVLRSQLLPHLLGHFFVNYMKPRLSPLECTSCSFKGDGQSTLLYGEVLCHIGKEHLFETLNAFEDNTVRKLFDKPSQHFEFQSLAADLLRSELCIYCLKTMPEGLEEHMLSHDLSAEPMQCDYCDGFPSFSSLGLFRRHNLMKHRNVNLDLQNLSLGSLAEIRSTLQIRFDMEGGPYRHSALTKRKLETEEASERPQKVLKSNDSLIAKRNQ